MRAPVPVAGAFWFEGEGHMGHRSVLAADQFRDRIIVVSGGDSGIGR